MIAGRGWVAGIAGVIVLSLAGALVLLITGSASMAEANAYFSQFDFSTAGPVEIDQAEYDVYNLLYSRGSTLAATAAPLLLSALGACCVLLAVLSQRYDRTHRREVQTEAPAAS